MTINPCTFNAFEITSGPDDAEYIIEKSLTSLGILTTNQGICTYEVTFEQVVKPPLPFITIDQRTGEVHVQSNDLSEAGNHRVELRAKITVPIDAIQSDFKTYETARYTFDLTLVDPCTLTEFDQLTLTDMTTSVRSTEPA